MNSEEQNPANSEGGTAPVAGPDIRRGDVHLDVCGLSCPMPLLKAKLALNDMAQGQLLSVVATDPGSVRDFEVFAGQSGHELLASTSQGDEFHYLLKRK
ncbi:MAG: sulfurtransferase TusA family protein [Pseudomonadaceae bacterium]|nr:sulfurtransferase TusA family protein [Pseudomonadaceae bacterium]